MIAKYENSRAPEFVFERGVGICYFPRGRPLRDDDPRFVFGRYRPGPSGAGPNVGAGPSSLLRRPPQPPHGAGSYREEEIYESADPDRGELEEAHDSGRWASSLILLYLVT